MQESLGNGKLIPMKKAVLFDLDGTLLPMDQEVFTHTYFKLLTETLAPRGYEPHSLIDGIWKGTAAMVGNGGKKSNEAVFWERFKEIFGERAERDRPLFEEFYRTKFNEARAVCGFAPEARETVAELKGRGRTLVLASNPIFPLTAQHNRMRWAGVDAEDFAYVTSYENSSYCKPNPEYYTEICEKTGLDPADCLMVGNDAREDLAARQCGMDVFLLTPCLINREGIDLARIPHGDYADLHAFLRNV